MLLNKELVGKAYAPTATEATLEAMQNYARAYNDDNASIPRHEPHRRGSSHRRCSRS